MVAPDAVETACLNSPRPMKCGSRSASSNVATIVAQQSAFASTGRHSSALRPATIAATAALVAAGSRASSANSGESPIAAVKASQNFCSSAPQATNLPSRVG